MTDSLTVDEAQDLAVTLRRTISGDVRFDAYSRALYSTDASSYQIEPLGVVVPRTVDDVAAVVALCADRGVPVLARGAGSSLAGQAVGRALILDCSRYLDRIEALDVEARQVSVQPGVVISTVNARLAAAGLMLGPDPASAERATVGGSLANNATGAHSLRYGMFADQVVDVDVVLADGSRATLDTTAPTDAVWQTRAQGTSRTAAVYRGVAALLETYASDIRTDFPGHWRRASGYGLGYLLPDAPGRHPTYERRPLGLSPLLAGSEGTLAIVTRATLAVVPRPPHTALAVLQFDSLVAAMEATNLILTCSPSAIELMDDMLIELARRQPATQRLMGFVDGAPAALLAVEFTGADERELTGHLDRLATCLAQAGWPRKPLRLLDTTAQAAVWQVRKAGLGILMSVRGDFKPIPGIEDVSVPVARLPEYVADVLDLVARHDTRASFYAHASAGCLHVRPLINLKSAEGVRRLSDLARAAVELAVRYGGVMSGEHGDGLARSALNERLFTPRLYAAMRELKTTFDPQNLLNPGKVVDAAPLTENLRYGPSYHTVELRTHLDFSTDGGFAGAVEMCNGAGVCRKLDAGTMCPSFQATRDEADSTRGRANALRAALSGHLPVHELTGDGMAEVMDLCLSCKACKTECPSSVDMAKIKTEFLAQTHDVHGTPLRSRVFGHIAALYALGAPLAPLANPLLESLPARYAMSRVGIHPSRSLPPLAGQRFSAWFDRRSRPLDPGPNGPVVLFHDTWTEYNYPELGRAAVQVLEAAGFHVILERRRSCCGRPMLSKGLVEDARRHARHNVAVLAPYVAAGMPIVGLEPSCILTFRDEYLALLPGSENARALAAAGLTIEEFLAAALTAGRLQLDFKSDPRPLLLHGHCHQKALVGTAPALSLLRLLPGRTVSEINSGCCGMAGSFGYETEHYAISETIAADRLLPAIAAAPQATIVADGVSCREQIRHFSGRRAYHLIEVLAAAL